MSSALAPASVPYLPFVPQEDAAEFLEVRPKAREKAQRLHGVAVRVHAAPKARKTATYQECARELGVAFNTLYAPVNGFLKSGDWRHLIDRSIAGAQFWLRSHPATHPADFIQFWHGLVESNQRCAAAAYSVLMERLRLWRSGDPQSAIPGFAVPPLNATGCRHPRKMSLRDLMRILPGSVELTASRNGRTEAMKHLPAIHTTRKGGWPCMEYQFDDMWHDFEVIHNAQICRLLEFNAVDFYSGFIFNPGLKPRFKNDEGRNETLTEREFRLWSINFLATTGWSPRGTTLQGERGTAAFRALAPKLIHWSNGLLKIPLPGMSGAPAIVGGHAERAKGNPNAKALKEGLGKLIHNRLADLPGQIGMHPADRPASSFGRDKETMDLLALQQHIPTPLNLTHMPFEHAAYVVVQRYMDINRRHDHDMEGWIEEGLYTQEYHADPARDLWINIGDLPESSRQAITIIAASNPDSLRPRRLSPHEVIAPALPHNIRLCPEAEADCLYEDARRTLAVTNGHLSFQDKDYGPGTYRYIAEYQGRDGFRRLLPNDEEVQLVCNPFNPERAFLYNPKGVYLGIVQRDHSIQRADRDAIHRAQGNKERLYKDTMLAAAVRHGTKREHQLTDNARILLDSMRYPATVPTPTAPAYDLSADYASADLAPATPAHVPMDASILL
jgi:hypothetical protein